VLSRPSADSFAVGQRQKAFVSPMFKPGQPQPGINNYYYANKRLDSVNNKLTEAEKVVIDGIYGKYLEQGINLCCFHQRHI
jgi:hypothetical protein